MHLAAEQDVPAEERDRARRRLQLGRGLDFFASRALQRLQIGGRAGAFLTYACSLAGKMILPEVERNRSFDIWLSYHPGSGRIPRVRHVIGWLVEAFNPAKYPWFRDEFVHPREFGAVTMGEPLTHLFGGFSTEGR
jgi:hypothetical protein